MRLTKIAISIVVVAFAAFLFQGCRKVDTGDIEKLTAADLAKTEPPYNNKEPEKYQVEIWQTSPTGTEKFFIVRNGDKWRIDSAYGSPDQVSNIHTEKDLVLSFAAKSYAEFPTSHGYDEREGMVTEISLGMLNSKAKGVYERTGTEDGVTKYKVTSDADKGKESVVSFDEKLGIPVRKEIYKGTGAERTLEMTVTLNGFKPEADEGAFVLPKEFKKVSVEEIKKILSGIKQ